MHNILQIGDEIRIEIVEPGAPLVLVFSSVNSNGFSFFKHLDPLKVSKIFVRDSTDQWFLNGTGVETTSIQHLCQVLSEQIRQARPSRVVSFGSSMGGYAAMLFGMRLRADHIVASSPQTLLDTRLPHTPSKSYANRPEYDLQSGLPPSERSEVTMFFGSADLVDVYNAYRVHPPRTRRFAVSDQDHLAAAFLAKRGEILRALEAAILQTDYVPDVPLDDRFQLDPRLVQLSIEVVERYYLGSASDAEAKVRELIGCAPQWAAPRYLYANLLFADGRLDAAEAEARAASLACPGSVTFADMHANVLLRQGRLEDSVDAYRHALEIRPKHYNSLCSIATALHRLRRTEEALGYLHKALEIRPRLKRAHVLRQEIDDDARAAGRTPAPAAHPVPAVATTATTPPEVAPRNDGDRAPTSGSWPFYDLDLDLPTDREDDTDDYVRTFGASVTTERPFLNVGAGDWRHPIWKNLDYVQPPYHEYTEPDINLDMGTLAPLPLPEESLHLIYTSHTLEHLTAAHNEHWLREFHRVLTPGGVLRIVVPDIETAYWAYMLQDARYYDQRYASCVKGDKILIKRSSGFATKLGPLHRSFLARFASCLGNPKRLPLPDGDTLPTEEALVRIFGDMSAEGAFSYILGLADYAKKKPFQHINWFTYDRLRAELRKAGFTHVLRTSYGQSVSPLMRNKFYFDRTRPNESLYVDAIKRHPALSIAL